MKKRIVAVGSSNIDLLMIMDHLPEKGETVTDGIFSQVYGGKVANRAAALMEGKGMSEAIEFANAAAAISVTRMGAQPSAPGRDEIEAFLRNSRIP